MTASALSPAPKPAAAPQAMATTFLMAPQISTPVTSPETYTLKPWLTTSPWSRLATSGVSEASTAAESLPRQTSSAWLGPERTAIRSRFPSSSATTSSMSSFVPTSTPFVRTSSGTSPGTRPASEAHVPLR